MKTRIIACLASAGFLLLPACTTVEETSEPSVHSTTTTEETVVHRPTSATTETRTLRAY
ncbi:MAG: hypothetical protein M3463_03135 [Verrucomicrobiota bacterium]|nr:hypothetical protein [Verrucomicrobiota bacterium]